MTVTVNLYYTGTNGAAQAFVKEMLETGVVAQIRAMPGNERYEYFQPLNDSETILLIDAWQNQAAIDVHHASPMMAEMHVYEKNMIYICVLNATYLMRMAYQTLMQLSFVNNPYDTGSILRISVF